MDAATLVGLGTLTTAVVGLGLVNLQLRAQRRATKAELGNLYVQRYWTIDDDLLLEPKESPKHKQHRHRYLRLFEDEFEAARLDFLDDKQWAVWHSVLDDQATADRVVEDLAVCDPEQGQFQHLRACIAQRQRESGSHRSPACAGMRPGPSGEVID